MRIQLPSPNEYLHREDLFFEQLELAIYHAKKAWAKVKALYPEYKDENDNYPWLSFSLGIDEGKVELLLNEIDPDFEKRQEISIEINEL